ncbi:GPI-anchor transamidase subunit GAB1 [Aspergillus clavatus NRRL 1]|uniref:GPI transamidase component PIG-U, putative n=1 Tax=Aspergillus clavatus (strain ATCC 1007 / CBS 513.65 / DSM 816 / NCTC 3887 / NRRL 1 / QM 1276 / 107) TaxID=344612 RepID=A1CHD2_ASPCL|nr:GPI transamidase component PIG-U, putative [Aspergillus clavatus NRRL 1]EAW10287.1 GPI transamidase component PIG-U, putative [Aspergillus clavatus NRRL 1]
MAVDRRKVAVFGGAFVLRLLLSVLFPSLPDLLTGRVEVSTPVNSFKRLQEGLFLYTRNVSPYDGGVFHQAPLLLPLFALLPNARDYPFVTAAFYALIDLVNANALVTISNSGQAVSGRLYSALRKDIKWDGVEVAAWFLFNPTTIAACLGRSTSAFTSTAILYAVSNAATGNSFNAMLALGCASYLSIYPALLFAPLVILCYDRRAQDSRAPCGAPIFAIQHFGIFLLSVGGLLGLSCLVAPDFWQFICATYGFQLLVPDLTPNIGLWWYFFIEIFDSFREFFLGVFWLHLTGYVGGLTVRLRRQPLFVLASLLGIFAIFKPYPSISDASLYFALLPLYRHLFPFSALLYATLLGPAFYHLWIYAGSGNANFFYAITLVWSLGLSILVADTIFAALRDEWEQENPELRGKDVRQV